MGRNVIYHFHRHLWLPPRSFFLKFITSNITSRCLVGNLVFSLELNRRDIVYICFGLTPSSSREHYLLFLNLYMWLTPPRSSVYSILNASPFTSVLYQILAIAFKLARKFSKKKKGYGEDIWLGNLLSNKSRSFNLLKFYDFNHLEELMISFLCWHIWCNIISDNEHVACSDKWLPGGSIQWRN